MCLLSSVDIRQGRIQKERKGKIEANDPGALCFMGTSGFQAQDYDKAVEYWAKAAELGDAEAHFKLGLLYTGGEGDEKDDDKGVYHLEKAAIGGHPQARHILGLHEEASEDGRLDRAVKHYIIAANLGCEYSMKRLLPMYKYGFITKEDSLRTHQAAIDATNSSQRDLAPCPSFGTKPDLRMAYICCKRRLTRYTTDGH